MADRNSYVYGLIVPYFLSLKVFALLPFAPHHESSFLRPVFNNNKFGKFSIFLEPFFIGIQLKTYLITEHFDLTITAINGKTTLSKIIKGINL